MAEAAYVDTSCLLKLLVAEPDTAAVTAAIDSEEKLTVSSLAELEVRSHLLALRRGGALRFTDYRAAIRRFDDLLRMDPFNSVALAGDVFDVAIAQVKQRGAPACRSLDRLHIAAMQALGLSRLLTTDRQQAAVAKRLGYAVIRPSAAPAA